MRPRTKLQARVALLSNDLMGLSKNEKKWAEKNCLPKIGYSNKTNSSCLECGEAFSNELVKRKRAECPSCKTKLSIVKTRRTTRKVISYFAITEVVEEFQVVRNFKIEANYRKGWRAEISIDEVLQQWVSPNLKVTLFGKLHRVNSGLDCWTGELEIRTNIFSYYGRKYEITPAKIHPDSSIKEEYLKFGVTSNLVYMSFVDAINKIPNSPKLETIVKAKQYQLLRRYDSVYRHWDSIKICLRNKYKIKDAIIWMDYIDLLRYFKKDIRNPKFVCPPNLKREHDILMRRKAKRENELRRQREILEAKKRQEDLAKASEDYIKRNQKFFSLKFTDADIDISLLKTIGEFKEEGEVLKHCVYVNEYYLKEDSLIFSAKVNGTRTETIEFSISKNEVIQSRGLGNNKSDYNHDILSLFNSNISKIRSVIKSKMVTVELGFLKTENARIAV